MAPLPGMVAMRKMMMAGAMALVLGACSDGTLTEPEGPQFAKAQQSSGLEVVVMVGGAVEYRGAGPSNTGVGTCLPGGSWNNTARGYITDAAHPNCASVVGGSPVALSIGGRMNGGTLRDAGWWLGYQSGGKDNTWGSGSATKQDAEGNSWWLYLKQDLVNDRGDFLAPGATVAMLCSAGVCHPGLLSW
jgi:hypothetical protein